MAHRKKTNTGALFLCFTSSKRIKIDIIPLWYNNFCRMMESSSSTPKAKTRSENKSHRAAAIPPCTELRHTYMQLRSLSYEDLCNQHPLVKTKDLRSSDLSELRSPAGAA